MDEVSALMGIGLEDEEELRALADSLRGRKRAADFFAATTVIPIREAANREQESIEEAAAQGGVLKRALEDRRSREEEGRLDRASREEIERLNRDARMNLPENMTPKYTQPMRGPDGQLHMVGMIGTQWMDFTSGVPLQNLEGYAPSPMTEGQEQRATASMPDSIRSMTKLAQAIRRADAALAPFAEGGGDPRSPHDIPGAGRISGKPGVWGWGARRMEELEGDNPDRVYSALEYVRHVLVLESAGLTQTINEMAAQLGISGREFLSNPDVFFEYYDDLKRRLASNMATTYKAQSPAIQAQWKEQFGAGDADPLSWEPKYLEFPHREGGVISDMLPGKRSVDRVIGEVRSLSVDEMSDEEAIEEARKRGWGAQQ